MIIIFSKHNRKRYLFAKRNQFRLFNAMNRFDPQAVLNNLIIQCQVLVLIFENGPDIIKGIKRKIAKCILILFNSYSDTKPSLTCSHLETCLPKQSQVLNRHCLFSFPLAYLMLNIFT